MSSRKFAAISLVLVLGVSTAFASAPQQSQQDQQKAMEAYIKMMATNENHVHLAKFAGDWNVTTTARNSNPWSTAPSARNNPLLSLRTEDSLIGLLDNPRETLENCPRRFLGAGPFTA